MLDNFDTQSHAHLKKGNTIEALQKIISIAPAGWAFDFVSVSKAVD